MTEHNDWTWYLDALTGKRGELERGNPRTGYYRDRNRAVAIWRDDDGALCCAVSSGYCPRTPDEIDDLFGFACTKPITVEVYDAFIESGRWPDDLPADLDAQTPAEGQPAHEIITQEIERLMRSYKDWLGTLPNGISNEDEDARAAKYATRLGELKKKAEDAHRAEKAPHLEAGRRVDQQWKPVVEAADLGKRAVLAPTVDYRRKRDDAERRARAEVEARIRAQQEAERAAGEVPTPMAPPPKKASGLRTVKVVEITDRVALATYIARLNIELPDFDEVLRKLARRMLDAGNEVPGARITEEKRAA